MAVMAMTAFSMCHKQRSMVLLPWCPVANCRSIRRLVFLKHSSFYPSLPLLALLRLPLLALLLV
jgi:hypothetical protein